MLRVVRVWGDTKNMVIKNLRVITRDSSGNSYCIGIASGQTTNTLTNTLTPRYVRGLTIENCYLEAVPAGTTGMGIESSITANNTLPAGLCPENITVRNCTIAAKQRGIFLHVQSGLVDGNDVTVTSGTGTTVTYAGIFPFSNNSTPGGTLVIRNNVVKMQKVPSTSAGQGGIGIFADATMNGTVLQVYNNIVKDFVFTSASGVDLLYRGINIGSSSSDALVEHNSIDAAANTTAVVSTTAGRVAGVCVPTALTTGTQLSVRNNIIRMGNPSSVAACIYFATPTGGTVISEGNNLVPNGTPNVGRISATSYPTLAAWQAAGYDSAASGGQSVDPASVVPAWDANLHFALKPVGLGTVASSTIFLDIDNDFRPPTGAYPGADEPPGPPASVADWAFF
jgi:hypothetical protein